MTAAAAGVGEISTTTPTARRTPSARSNCTGEGTAGSRALHSTEAVQGIRAMPERLESAPEGHQHLCWWYSLCGHL